MKITDYKPMIYENNLEMSSLLESEEKEFEENLKPSVDNAFNDTFIIKATEKGVENFELIYSITADPTTEDIETRKLRVLNRMLSQIPYTEKYMQKKFDEILGKNTNADFTPDNPNNTQWYYDLDYENYTLDIYVTVPGRTWLEELKVFLNNVIPCNLVLTINIYAANWQQVYESFDNWQDIYDEELTWEDVMNAEWLT